MSVPVKRAMPSIACRARSARNQSVCASRRAPAMMEITKASNVCSGRMALGLVSAKGMSRPSTSPSFSALKNSMTLTSPPKGVTGLAVEARRSWRDLKTGCNVPCIVRCMVVGRLFVRTPK